MNISLETLLTCKYALKRSIAKHRGSWYNARNAQHLSQSMRRNCCDVFMKAYLDDRRALSEIEATIKQY